MKPAIQETIQQLNNNTPNVILKQIARTEMTPGMNYTVVTALGEVVKARFNGVDKQGNYSISVYPGMNKSNVIRTDTVITVSQQFVCAIR